LVFSGTAAAHVTVNPATAVQGGYAALTFRTPNEKDTADTVKLEVVIPTDHPIASVAVKPVPGWTAQMEKSKLATPVKTDDGGEVTEAVSKITWTAAAGGSIKPGQFQEFAISAGPLPKVDKVVFKALQTYSDGDIVRWIEEPASDGKQPDHPAPTLALTAATDATKAPSAAAVAAATSGGAPAQASGTTMALVLGIVGTVVGVAGLLLALLAYRKASAASTRP
jgi:uncharacterized protein YcnI